MSNENFQPSPDVEETVEQSFDEAINSGTSQDHTWRLDLQLSFTLPKDKTTSLAAVENELRRQANEQIRQFVSESVHLSPRKEP